MKEREIEKETEKEREHLLMKRMIKLKTVTQSPNQLFILSYLLFNLVPMHKIRLMVVKWQRHTHCPSAEKSFGLLFLFEGKGGGGIIPHS